MQVLLMVPRVDSQLGYQKSLKAKFMFFCQSDITKTKKSKQTAGMLVTESPDWDAPKRQFSIQTNNKLKQTEISVRSTIEIGPYF